MTDIAELGLVVRSDGVVVATRRLDKLERQAGKTERKTKSATGSMAKGFGAVAAAAGGLFVAVQGFQSILNAALQMERINKALRFATGSSEAAANEFRFLQQEAERLGLELSSAAQTYASLTAAAKGTKMQGQEVRDIFVGISEAATVLSLTGEQTAGALRAIEQMISKGKVSAEELRGQLGERLPGAFQIAARAMHMTTVELDKALSSGEVMAYELLPALADELHKTFGPEVQSAVNGTQQQINRFKNSLFEFKNQLAEGGIISGFATAISFLGDALSKVDGVIIAVMGGILVWIEKVKYAWEVLSLVVRAKFEHAFSSLPAIVQKPIVDILNFWADVMERMSKMVGKLPDALKKAIPVLQVFESLDGSGLREFTKGLADGSDASNTLKADLKALAEQHQQTLDRINSTTLDMFMRAEGFNTAPIVAPNEGTNTGGTGGDGPIVMPTMTVTPSREMLAQLAEAERLTRSVRTEQEIYNAKFEHYTALLDTGFISQETFNRLMVQLKESQKDAGDGFKLLEQIAIQAARSMQTALADFFYSFDGGLKGMVKSFIDAVRKMIAQWLAFQTLKNTLGQFEMFAGFFTRASGGPVTAGQPYLVGEKGPELMVPNSSGTIIPNNKMGGTNITVNMPVDARGAVSPAQVMQMVNGAKQEIYYNLPRVLNGYAPA